MIDYSIIQATDCKWTDIISQCYQYDFYHTQAYSLLESGSDHILFVAYMDHDFIAMPLVIRKIERTDYLDCTSVYGYCGPVSNLPFESISQDLIKSFQNQLLQFFNKKGIVSAFSRLHPLMEQGKILENFGTIKDVNKTVAIDLKMPAEQQFANYRESHRRKIRKLLKEGYEVFEAKNSDELDIFIEIYNQSMIRLNSKAEYFFSKEYYEKFLKNPCFNSKLLLAKKDGEIAAGAIFTFTNKIVQYHLSGIHENYRHDAPMKLIIDHARLLGNEYQMNILHLGGGVNGSSDDSLFYFKTGFSDIRYMFKVWQLIVDESKYSSLIILFNIDPQKNPSYFPVYRSS
jgi:hypothetical protein